MRLDPLQNILLPPAQATRVRHLEMWWDQVCVLFVGRARANRVCCFSNQFGELLDEKDALRPAFCSRMGNFGHLSSFTGRQRLGRRTPRDAHAALRNSVKMLSGRWSVATQGS